MKNAFVLLLLIVGFPLNSQDLHLTDERLVNYYQLVNQAELKIAENDYNSAYFLYEKAFSIFEQPHAKDLYNRMKIALKINNNKKAFDDYHSLKCMEYPFKDGFHQIHFGKKTDKKKPCKNKIDLQYKQELDTLFILDQKYRRLSKGDYGRFQKEITKGDSIASLKLNQLIQDKGFPNEYDIGLKSSDATSFHHFYYIIWHQLASNIYSPQRVNFTSEINKALNKGKITPDIAAFLSDLNNNSSNYDSKHFEILKFSKNDYYQENKETQKKGVTEADCCYVHEWFFPENRNESGVELVNTINRNRQKIGLSSLDDHIKKRLFTLHNNEFRLPVTHVIEMNFKHPEDTEKIKKHLIKIP